MRLVNSIILDSIKKSITKLSQKLTPSTIEAIKGYQIPSLINKITNLNKWYFKRAPGLELQELRLVKEEITTLQDQLQKLNLKINRNAELEEILLAKEKVTPNSNAFQDQLKQINQSKNENAKLEDILLTKEQVNKLQDQLKQKQDNNHEVGKQLRDIQKNSIELQQELIKFKKFTKYFLITGGISIFTYFVVNEAYKTDLKDLNEVTASAKEILHNKITSITTNEDAQPKSSNMKLYVVFTLSAVYLTAFLMESIYFR